MKSIDIRLINAIVEAAEREGGIHMLEMPFTRTSQKKCWHRCISMGAFWYNNAITHSTNAIRLKKK